MGLIFQMPLFHFWSMSNIVKLSEFCLGSAQKNFQNDVQSMALLANQSYDFSLSKIILQLKFFLFFQKIYFQNGFVA